MDAGVFSTLPNQTYTNHLVIISDPRDDYEDRYSEYGGERPSRPSSRAGSITHSQYNPDSSFGFGFNNSISSQWAMFQQQQEILRKAMQEQMMGLNPLQFQVNKTNRVHKTRPKVFRFL